MQTLTKRPEQKQELKKAKATKKYVASAVIALSLFLIANLSLFAIFGPVKSYGNDLWNGTGSIDLSIKDFEALKQTPDVVLLGSSLIMYPFWSMDFADHKKIGDLFHHHRSFTLEKRLQEIDPIQEKKPMVFSWAIFGQMASDGYIYANEFLKGDKKPKVLVWGIAPRDFNDAELSSPMNTISFQRLVNLNNFNDYSDIYLPTFQDKAEFLISKSVFLYGRRWHIQKEVNKGADKLVLLANPTEDPKQDPTRKPGFEKKSGGGLKFTGGREEIWEHSTMEYSRRYKNVNLDKLRVQLGFMKRLLGLCKARGIDVLVVNMPLTKTNRGLMPDGFYQNYRDEIAKLSKEGGAKFVDCGPDPNFIDADFWDTAHMSHQGGYKLLDRITPVLNSMLQSK